MDPKCIDLNPPIERALLSVSDKTGIVEFALDLTARGIEIISTGGTAKALREAGITVTDVSTVTGFPKCFDGRVKTLHPNVHGGILFRRTDGKHEAQANALRIMSIDLVVVNLYPFEQTVAKPGVTDEEAIENIDIGGPSMLRSAAKNHEFVTVVVDPADYETVVKEMIENNDTVTYQTRRALALKAFARTAAYDNAIVKYFEREKAQV